MVEQQKEGSCPHYNRGCSLVAPCCEKVYACRLCHDDKDISHPIDRYAIKEVICRKCCTRQPVSNKCVECTLVFGMYFCSICNFYDNEDKAQFHCEKCGLCRIGGRENYFHCDDCGMCLPNSMQESHACRQDSSKNNCPVCMEDIHTSRVSAHIPECGHLIHMSCYKELLTQRLYQCPQCQTSLVDMESCWKKTDEEISNWEMPQHLKNFKVQVKCRDCHKETAAVFHIIGLKCGGCGSYNTVRCGNEEIPEDAVPINFNEYMAHVQESREQVEHDDDNEEESDD